MRNKNSVRIVQNEMLRRICGSEKEEAKAERRKVKMKNVKSFFVLHRSR
jgi:hypothetical protein